MNIRYRIIPSLNRNQSLIIHPNTAKKLGIQYRKIAYLRFGVHCVEVKMDQTDEINPQEIILNNEIIKALMIPLCGSYEMMIKGYEIVIGPYIGILVHKKEETLDKNIKVYSNYLYNYEAIGGIVLAFSIEGIQTESEKISGYIFNPQTKKWEKAFILIRHHFSRELE